MLWRNGLVGECFYFVGNVLVQVRHVFLPNYPLVLSLLKSRSVWGILEQKKSGPNKGNPLKSSIDEVKFKF